MPTPASIVIQSPAGAPQQLILLFHGVGSNAADLVPAGKQFAAAFPKALVASVEGLQASDFGQGRQWFSIAGITEESRCARVAAAMPDFRDLVAQWQQESGVAAARTTLIGFSQGAIMALESTQHEPALAAHVIAFSGRFAAAPTLAPAGTAIHLIHGDADTVLPADHSRNAAKQLRALGATVSLDIEAAMGHGINAHMVSLAFAALSDGE
jgi:phospholipase/carboxylesterase